MTERANKLTNISNTFTMATAGISIALVFVATAFINLRLPIAANGGLIHLGNVPLFVAAILFGKRVGFLAGALGMALFDLMGGWVAWAPFTFIIVGAIGYAVAVINEEGFSYSRYLLAMLAAVIIKVTGYYIAEGLIYGNWVAPAASIPGNLVQMGVAAVIALPLVKALIRYKW